MALSERTLARIWENPDDAEYDRLAARGGTPRGTESGEAPVWQGVRRAHIGHM